MEALVWTKSDLSRDFAGDDLLFTALRTVERRLAESGCVVCQVFVDGKEIVEENEERELSERRISMVEDFRVSFQPIDALVLQSVLSVLDMIPRVCAVSTQTAQMIREGRHQGAVQLIVRIVESCYWLTETFINLRTLDRARQGAKLPEDLWKRGEVQLQTVVKGLLTALESGDYVLVADFLDGHLVEVLEIWQDITLELQKTLQPEMMVTPSERSG